MEIKDLIIFLLVFLIVLWLQNNDDKRYNKKRDLLYDIIKLPLFVAIMVLVAKDVGCCVYDNIKMIFFINDIQPNIKIYSKNDISSNDIFLGPPDF